MLETFAIIILAYHLIVSAGKFKTTSFFNELKARALGHRG
jgi:hypothetical protein